MINTPPSFVTSPWALHRPRGQLAVLGLAVGGVGLANPKNFVRAWHYGAGAAAAYADYRELSPALGPSHKVGLRFGGTGQVQSLNRAFPGISLYGVEGQLPVPTFGFGFTAVPVSESRRPFSTKSRKPRAKSSQPARRASSATRKKPAWVKSALNTKLVRYQNRRRARCRKVYRGKRCKSSLGHRGRHSYR